MEFVMVGQPNCGKSTIFNEVIGYKSMTSNFPGATIHYTRGSTVLDHHRMSVVDLPGTYSLQTSDEVEQAAVDFLSNLSEDSVIINIVDGSVLSRSLELTLQLMELQKPMVIGLNMMDEVSRKGITIDSGALSDILGIPVIQTNGRSGEGVYELFREAQKVTAGQPIPEALKGPRHLEEVIGNIQKSLAQKKIPPKWHYRLMAIKLLEKDRDAVSHLEKHMTSSTLSILRKHIKKLESQTGRDSDFVVSSMRHDMAFQIFEKVAVVGEPPKKDFRSRLDDLLMHPFWGYVSMALILSFVFWSIFKVGGWVEPVFLENIESIQGAVAAKYQNSPFLYVFLRGFIEGLGGGIGIVIPYLLPFFIMLSLLEDTGYLARIAYMIDNIMHKIGLHGMSVIPLVLGFGCTVPAILSARILRSKRDKFITAALATMVPCSAKMTVIFGLVGFFISIKAALLIYVLNIVIIGLSGRFFARVLPEVSPGLILEIPEYHVPSLRTLMKKTYLRIKEFIWVAWPLLIVGSIVLEMIKHFHWEPAINSFLSPFTGLLGLPVAVGITLVFGLMRKELALLLLFSALGTRDVLTVMTPAQIYGFTVFVTFYVPCLATIIILIKEVGWGKALFISVFTTFIAIVLSMGIRYLAPLFS